VNKLSTAFVCLLALLAASIVATAAAAEIRIQHAKGETVLPAVPKKVLVLDVPSLDNLDALGVQPTGVPGGNLPSYLAKYEAPQYLKIGSLFEPDYEAINAAEAELAIVGGRSSAKYQEVATILPTIDLSVDNQDYLASAKNNIETLGKIFNKEQRAKEMLSTLDNNITALKQRAGDSGRAIILITNAGKVGVYGRGSRLGWLHNDIGFKTVADDIDDRFHGGDIVSFEYILEKNPDWLFVVDRDAAIGQRNAGNAAEQVLNNALIQQTTAWKKQQIVYLKPQQAYIVSSGWQALTSILEQLQQAMNKARAQ